MRRFALVVGMIAVLIVGCGSLDADTGAVSPGQPQPATASAGQPQAVSPPLTIKLLLDQQRLTVGGTTPLTLQAIPNEAVPQAVGKLHGSGVVTVGQPAQQTWRNVSAQQMVDVQTTVQITGLGTGEITAEVQVLDATGTPRYGQSTTVYVLATEQGVLSGTAGPQQLKREQLAQARAAGRLTEDEYQKALEQLQYGGAQESITITVPTRVP